MRAVRGREVRKHFSYVIEILWETVAYVGLRTRHLFSRKSGNPEPRRTTAFSTRDSWAPAFAGEPKVSRGLCLSPPRRLVDGSAQSTEALGTSPV